jgi:AraC family transcriptional regulator of adaptative response/methylated-DNA-[protein]-cysteine methyltransferase
MITTPKLVAQRLPRPSELHRAVDQRDPSYEGIFLVGVRTTGIFCRPTCPSKPALRENRRFFASSDAAVSAGFRPCRRCKPLEHAGTHPAWVSAVLALLDENPAARLTAATLERLGIHPAAARRYFLRSFGMTLQGYARARRLGLALDALQRGTPVLPAGFESGFESDSGFRDAFKRVFGVTPTEARGMPPIVVTLIASPLGPLVAAATDTGLCMLEFAERKKLPQQAADLRRWFARPVVPGTNRYTDQIARELDQYFGGTRREFSVPLELGGTPFQETVWRELLRIPYGATISYEELARRIGKPKAQRAVGMANGRNRFRSWCRAIGLFRRTGSCEGTEGGFGEKSSF